jgi:beta-1,2-mannobiose phosphorylase / 1,2-beta-oligomannan phosphorylase
LGLATFRPFEDIEFDGIDNKDASIFPVPIRDPHGQPAMAILHRPLFPGTSPEEKASLPDDGVIDRDRESIWISYCPIGRVGNEPYHLSHFASHNRLASPVRLWERLKIGGGTPPVLTKHGWMTIYHGVHKLPDSTPKVRRLCYSAGVLILSADYPREILYRSPDPVLTPELKSECVGTVANVVFPTAIDRRDDMGLPNRFDVYYGMADDRIGVARLNVPDRLPPGNVADPPEMEKSHRAGRTAQ